MGHIPHLYVPGPWTASGLALESSQQHHLAKVLRMHDGDPVTYTDGAGTTGQGRLRDGGIARGDESHVARRTTVGVAVAPPSSRQRCRFLVEKLAELAVERLIWVSTRHTEGRPPAEDKVKAWIEAAVEQSRGAWVMQTSRAGIGDLESEQLIVADASGEASASVVSSGSPLLLVGPEGGLDEDEIPPDVPRISLGPTVLRVETAAVVGASLLSRLQASGDHH